MSIWSMLHNDEYKEDHCLHETMKLMKQFTSFLFFFFCFCRWGSKFVCHLNVHLLPTMIIQYAHQEEMMLKAERMQQRTVARSCSLHLHRQLSPSTLCRLVNCIPISLTSELQIVPQSRHIFCRIGCVSGVIYYLISGQKSLSWSETLFAWLKDWHILCELPKGWKTARWWQH